MLKSNFVKPEEMGLTQEVRSGSGDFSTDEYKGRVNAARTALTGHIASLQLLQNNLADNIDTFVKKVSEKLYELSFFGINQTGSGYMHAEIKAIFSRIHAKINALVERWNDKQTAYTALETQFAAALTPEEEVAILKKMESIISSQLTTPVPLNYKNAVDTKKAAFDALHNTFKGYLITATPTLSSYLNAVKANALTLINFDAVPLDSDTEKKDLSSETEAILRLRTSIQEKISLLVKDIQARDAKVTALFTAAENKTAVNDILNLLLQAGKQVLGEELILLPKFKFSASQGQEIQNAIQPAAIDQLLKYQVNTLKNKFPVDDWLYSMARIKEKMFHWENITFLTEAFNTQKLPLTPLQFPYQTNNSWLAMEFPTNYVFENERLLYTAYFDSVFDKSGWQCGLLVEDWTEVIPSKRRVYRHLVSLRPAQYRATAGNVVISTPANHRALEVE